MTNKIDLNNIPENFVITYYANKHNKIKPKTISPIPMYRTKL